MNKRIFIATWCASTKSGGGYGVEAHLIYADNIQEATNICPGNEEDDFSIFEVLPSTETGIKDICDYYE